MKIIGIDPGLNTTGWAVLEKKNRSIYYLDSGKITTSNKQNMLARLGKINEELGSILLSYQPEFGAIEEIFVNKNPRSSLKLCHARGAILLTLSLYGVSNVSEYAPNYIKKNITGNGHATKEQVLILMQRMIKGLATINHDIADAIAICFCHTLSENQPFSQ